MIVQIIGNNLVVMEWLIENTVGILFGAGFFALISFINHKKQYSNLDKKVNIITEYFLNPNKGIKQSISQKLQQFPSSEKRKFTLENCIFCLIEIIFLLFLVLLLLFVFRFIIYMALPLIKLVYIWFQH